MSQSLVDIALRHFPTGIYGSEPGYHTRPEAVALMAARTQALADTAWWIGFCGDVGSAYPGHMVEDKSLLHLDRCWRLRVPLYAGVYEHAVVCCVSFVAPLWLPYVSLPPSDGLPPHLAWKFELSPEEETVAGELNELLHGSRAARRVTPDEARLVVPDVAVDSIDLGQATVADCLFTSDRS